MKPRKPKVLSPAEAIVAPWLAKLGLKSESLAVFEAWDRLLGAEATKAKAVGIKGSVLYVDVDHSARLHDLTLRKPQLLRKLQGFFGGKPGSRQSVSDIIFKLSDGKQ